MSVVGTGGNAPRSTGGLLRSGDSLLAAVALLGVVLLTNRGWAGETWPPPSAPSPSLELQWNDHYELLKSKLPPAGREVVEQEITRVFAEIDVPVDWQRGSQVSPPATGTVAVRIVLMPSSPEAWNLSRDAMGAVMGKELVTRTLYVFFPAVLYGIGDSSGPGARVESPWEMGRLAVALARVVAHEVVHALAPELPHAEKVGIMSARLTPSMLRRQTLSFTEATGVHLRQSLLETRASGPKALRASTQ